MPRPTTGHVTEAGGSTEKGSDKPDKLRPFQFHGVAFGEPAGDEATAEECPFCGRERKFRVNVVTGKCGCWHPGCFEGNAVSFVRRLWESSPVGDLSAVAEDRRLLDPDSLTEWGMRTSALTGDLILPGWNAGGQVVTLYKWARSKAGKRVLMGTAGLDAGFFRTGRFDQKAPTVWLCEGPWDAVALRETMRRAKVRGEEVVALPGAGVLPERWLPLFAGKRVVLAFDHDDAGRKGAEAAARKLHSPKAATESVGVVHWPPGEPDGWDVRDHLTLGSPTAPERARRLETLVGMVGQVPEEWTVQGSPGAVSHLDPVPCASWKEVVNAWRKAMDWTPELEHILSVALASVVSTETKGEPIWVLVLAPPSSGKTTVLDAIAVASEFVVKKSELNRMYSGYKADKAGAEDFSIVPQIDNRTLMIMDGDSILKNPSRGQILAQIRALYDGFGNSHYNNGTSRSYVCRFTLVIAGTASMLEMDASEVGARFVNCCFDSTSDPDLESRVNERVFWREIRNSDLLVNGRAESRVDEDMATAKQLTGGYVQHLRRNAAELIGGVVVDPDRDAGAARSVKALGELVAFMRARQPKFQDEVAEREFSARLVGQFARLAKCLAAVMGKRRIDADVLARVRRVAFDTARGRTLDLTGFLTEQGDAGGTVAGLSVRMGESEEKTRARLTFLKRIGVVRLVAPESDPVTGIKPRAKWHLTERIKHLYQEARDASAD